jgi:hypothetical protein
MTMNHTAAQTFLNYLGVSLWISSTELTPESITRLVGIDPTYTRQRGTLIPGRNMLRRSEFDVHEWQFRKQLDAKPGTYLGQYIEQFITEFLSAIKPHTAEINKLSEHHNVTISFVYHVDELPYMGLTRDQIQGIAALGAKVDYDLMFERGIFDEADEPNSVEAG